MKHGWIDLNEASSINSIHSDICIIGAGAVGIYLASELVSIGFDVVLIEAGPLNAVDANQIGFEPLFSLDPYLGATKGRYFGIGGTTTRWGGALIPHTKHDLTDDPFTNSTWSTIVDRVRLYGSQVLLRLGYKHGSDFDKIPHSILGNKIKLLPTSGFNVQANLLLPFRRKNFIVNLHSILKQNARLKVFFNAVVRDWVFSSSSIQDERISEIRAISKSGNLLKVIANRFIISAGGIETSRILLEIIEAKSTPSLFVKGNPGCYLGDHLSLPIADVHLNDRFLTGKLFSPRFMGSWMRGFRFLENTPPKNAPKAFTHFIFPTESPGFNLVKKILQSIQLQQKPKLSFGDSLVGFKDIFNIAYCRIVESRMYVPRHKEIIFQLDIEQYPKFENRIILDAKRDEYGRKKVKINWSISENDSQRILDTANRILSIWPGPTAMMPKLESRAIDLIKTKPYDAYHPVGTCRMGSRGASVVDLNLKLWGIDNVWVVSTAVLPNAGTANPTFTILCLAHQLAKSFKNHFEKQ